MKHRVSVTVDKDNYQIESLPPYFRLILFIRVNVGI